MSQVSMDMDELQEAELRSQIEQEPGYKRLLATKWAKPHKLEEYVEMRKADILGESYKPPAKL